MFHSFCSLPGTLMVISLLSIVYGALRCNILAIKIRYDDYEVSVHPLAYLCVFLWRGFEIATRVAVLVLFSSVLKVWVLPVVSANFVLFFLHPWVLFWSSPSTLSMCLEYLKQIYLKNCICLSYKLLNFPPP
uniref:XK-related protein n=1 Tax=Cyprinus carpio TaxID=7962 RepID=A0A8C2GI47_CYPCA